MIIANSIVIGNIPSFGKGLSFLRKYRGFTLSELAYNSGVNIETLELMEGDQLSFSIGDLNSVLQALGYKLVLSLSPDSDDQKFGEWLDKGRIET